MPGHRARGRAALVLAGIVVLASLGVAAWWAKKGTFYFFPEKVECPLFHPWFVDATAGSGLDGVNVSGSGGRMSVPELAGQGLALFDYDHDGLLDIYLANGATVEGVHRGEYPPDRLYRNLGDGSFRDVTAEAGIAGASWSMGAAAADYDGDGDVDLYVTNVAQDHLWRNEGDGTFQDVAERSGIVENQFGTGAAWGDLDGDGDLDLYVANYCVFDPRDFVVRAPDGQPCNLVGNRRCGPWFYARSPDRLYLNAGEGWFEDASDGSGIRTDDPGYGFQAVLVDMDLDGDLDVFVANDIRGSANKVLMNQGGGRFREDAAARGLALRRDGWDESCMGVAIFDLQGDGLPDLGVTNFWEETNTIYLNQGGGRYLDRSVELGWTDPSFHLTGWGLGVFDFDHDGYLDLLSANGHVFPQADPHIPFAMPLLLMAGGEGGAFRELPGAGQDPVLAGPYAGRGVAFGDLDNDGDLDAVVLRLQDKPLLLVNRTGDGRPSLTVRLHGRAPNTQGLGARVEVQAGARSWWGFVLPHQSYLCTNDTRVHVGLAGRDRADRVTVYWPDGSTDLATDVAAGEITVRQGQGLVNHRPHGRGW